MSNETIVLHEDTRSGNCYKIRLLLAHLGFPYERRQYDILNGGTRTPEFLSEVNSNGRIPVLQVGDRYLPESNAALWYLAEGTRFVPEDRFDRADCLRWMFFEQYSHEPNIATLKFWKVFIGQENWTDTQRILATSKKDAGDAALAVMNEHLEGRQYLVGDSLTIADIALYAYTHTADQADFDLKAYPYVMAWVDAIALEPGHVPMEA